MSFLLFVLLTGHFYTSPTLELYVWTINWSRNGGEEEEEGKGMLYSRLGMPARINKMHFMVCVLLTGHFEQRN